MCAPQLAAAKTIIRIRTTKAAKGIKRICDRIQQHSKKRKGRKPLTVLTPMDRTIQWAIKATKEAEAPKTKKDLETSYKGLREYFKQKWKDRWRQGKKGAHTRDITSCPNKSTIILY
jgi:hypothetical protein